MYVAMCMLLACYGLCYHMCMELYVVTQGKGRHMRERERENNIQYMRVMLTPV